jgi:hypothetical protein
MTTQQLRQFRSHLLTVINGSRWLPNQGTLADSEYAPTYEDYKQDVFNLLVELDDILPKDEF